ncbi:MAG: hypothetical protein IT446_04070 [Phycisphaerales bacterium]|nr:hypothetical protein [Phycisphaerales bacterium]
MQSIVRIVFFIIATGWLMTSDGRGAVRILEQKTLASEHHIATHDVWKVELPKLSAAGSRLLKVTVRLQTPTMGGYNPYMHMSLNGRPLDAARDRYAMRLINKPPTFTRPDGKIETWNRGSGIWMTIFAPSFDTDFKVYGPNVTEPYTYLLDVSDLVHANGPNVLEIANDWITFIYEPKDLVVTLDWLAAELPQTQPAVPARPHVAMTPALSVTKDGAFTVASSDGPIQVDSSFSVPGGGHNRLGGASVEPRWKPRVTQVTPNEWRIEAAGESYSLTRTIRQTEGRIAIEDTFKNLTHQDIGIIFDNHLNLENHRGIDYARIGGWLGQGITDVNSRENPTLFFPLEHSSLSMVIEDDFYRNQGRFYFDPKAHHSGVRDEMFAMAPRSSYTVKWSLYVRPSDDYFDMINQVRRDWDVNVTIPGPIHWIATTRNIVPMPQEKLDQYLRTSGAKYITMWMPRAWEPQPRWDNLKLQGYGTGLFDPSFQEPLERVRTVVQKLHAANLGVHVGLYTEAFFVSPEKPDDQTHKDSWVTYADGTRAVSIYDETWKNDWYILRPIFPTLHNSYGKAYMKVIDYYLNNLKVDWIYWDESTGPSIKPQTPDADETEIFLTYNTWDGHSAKIDPKTGRIVQKCGIIALLSDDFIVAAHENIQQHGGFSFHNNPPVTVKRRHDLSMQEVQWDITRSYKQHLATPLAYGQESEGQSMYSIRRRLDHGLLLMRYSWKTGGDSPVRNFFPFTPIELHAGWVVGKERIITDRSGDFGWADAPFSGKLYLYDKEARLIATHTVEKRSNSLHIDVPDEGLAILVRNETTP